MKQKKSENDINLNMQKSSYYIESRSNFVRRIAFESIIGSLIGIGIIFMIIYSNKNWASLSEGDRFWIPFLTICCFFGFLVNFVSLSRRTLFEVKDKYIRPPYVPNAYIFKKDLFQIEFSNIAQVKILNENLEENYIISLTIQDNSGSWHIFRRSEIQDEGMNILVSKLVEMNFIHR